MCKQTAGEVERVTWFQRFCQCRSVDPPTFFLHPEKIIITKRQEDKQFSFSEHIYEQVYATICTTFGKTQRCVKIIKKIYLKKNLYNPPLLMVTPI